MGCIMAVLAVLTPRLAIAVIFLLTEWLQQAFDTTIWPVLGFLFMPYTTLAWMGAEMHGGVRGLWAVIVIVAVIVDLGHLFGGGRHYHTYRRDRAA